MVRAVPDQADRPCSVAGHRNPAGPPPRLLVVEYPTVPSAPALPTPAPNPAPAAPRTRASRSPWRSLRHRSMRWWSAANFASNTGTWMQLTVQNLLVLQITGSAAATGLSMSVQAAPALFISLLGGAAVDRWPRKLTVAVSQALLGAVASVTALLVALDRIDMTSLLVLAAVTGVIATVDGPACALLGNDLVPVEDVQWAGARGALIAGGLLIAGAIAAGLLKHRTTKPTRLTFPKQDSGLPDRESLSTAA